MSLILMTPIEIAKHIAQKAKLKRLSLNWSQKTLSERAGVSFGVLKKFERTGKISLETLLKIAFVLDALDEFKELFKEKSKSTIASLDELLVDNTRKRGRH